MAFCTKHNLKIHSPDHVICNKSFWQPYRLQEHTTTHTWISPSIVQCALNRLVKHETWRSISGFTPIRNPKVVHYVVNHFLRSGFLRGIRVPTQERNSSVARFVLHRHNKHLKISWETHVFYSNFLCLVYSVSDQDPQPDPDSGVLGIRTRNRNLYSDPGA